eukprot:gene9136-11194_t
MEPIVQEDSLNNYYLNDIIQEKDWNRAIKESIESFCERTDGDQNIQFPELSELEWELISREKDSCLVNRDEIERGWEVCCNTLSFEDCITKQDFLNTFSNIFRCINQIDDVYRKYYKSPTSIRILTSLKESFIAIKSLLFFIDSILTNQLEQKLSLLDGEDAVTFYYSLIKQIEAPLEAKVTSFTQPTILSISIGLGKGNNGGHETDISDGGDLIPEPEGPDEIDRVEFTTLPSEEVLTKKFTGWFEKYGKKYTDKEFKNAYKNFVNSIKDIIAFNINPLREKTMTLALNKFSDISHDEFVETILMNTSGSDLFKDNIEDEGEAEEEEEEVDEDTQSRKLFAVNDATAIPKNRDWRMHNQVSPVKDQRGCGSCYAFAALAGLESYYLKKYKKIIDLSEQQILDCNRGGKFANKGCREGSVNNVYSYLKKYGGVTSESIYPYHGKVEKCSFDKSTAKVKISNFYMVKGRDENKLKKIVATKGPVAVGFQSNIPEFKNYGGGIFHSNKCKAEIDHIVLIVGYGVSKEGVPYWIVKNSWGDDWGEKGFFRLKRNTNNKCGIASFPYYPVIQ